MRTKNYVFSSLIGLVLSIGASAQYDISTVAGTSTQGYNGDGIAATTAELSGPYGVYVDIQGNIYISDYSNNRVRMVNTTGIISTVAGNGVAGYSGDGGAATAAEVNYVRGVTVDISGNIYISDFFNHRIRMVNTSGIISTYAGNGTGGYNGDNIAATNAELFNPQGVALDASGNLYISDEGNERIRMVNTSGIITTIAGNGVAGYSGDGGQATAAEVYDPNGVAVDAAGNIYLDDEVNNCIRKVNTSGIISTFAGNTVQGYNGDGGPATASEMYQPIGVAVDAMGNVFIGDNNMRIRMVDPSGNISTVGGDGHNGFYGDGGPATSAEISSPWSVCVDPSGNVFMGDWGNNRIRKLTNLTSSTKQLTASNDKLTVYPNPSNGVFTISMKNEELRMKNIEVYNVLGEKVFAKFLIPNSQFLINISSHPNGIYLYRVVSQSGELVGEGKLIKE